MVYTKSRSKKSRSQNPKSQKSRSQNTKSQKGGSLASDKVMKVANGVGMTVDDYSKMPLPKMGSLKKQTGAGNCASHNKQTGGASCAAKQNGGASCAAKQTGGASCAAKQNGGASCAAKQTGGASCAAKQTGGAGCGGTHGKNNKRSKRRNSKKQIKRRTKKVQRKGQKGGRFLNLAGCGPVNAPDAGRKYAKHFSKTSSCPGPEFYANPPELDKAGSGSGNAYPFN